MGPRMRSPNTTKQPKTEKGRRDNPRRIETMRLSEYRFAWRPWRDRFDPRIDHWLEGRLDGRHAIDATRSRKRYIRGVCCQGRRLDQLAGQSHMGRLRGVRSHPATTGSRRECWQDQKSISKPAETRSSGLEKKSIERSAGRRDCAKKGLPALAWCCFSWPCILPRWVARHRCQLEQFAVDRGGAPKRAGSLTLQFSRMRLANVRPGVIFGGQRCTS